MPARIRSPKQQRSSRKLVSSALADLASRRRASRNYSYKMSSRAEHFLHDGDESDGESVRISRHASMESSRPGAGGYAPQLSYAEGDDETATYVSHTFEAAFDDEDDPQPQMQQRKKKSIFSPEASMDDIVASIPTVVPRSISAKRVEGEVADEANDQTELEDLARQIYSPASLLDLDEDEEYPDDESPPMSKRKLIDLDTQRQLIDLDKAIEEIQQRASIDPEEQLQEEELFEEKEEEDLDEAIKAGNEALLFVYGHNTDLYAVFDVPPDATNAAIDHSYQEQMEQLSLARDVMASSDPEYKQQAAILCGMQAHHLRTLDPKTFVEIKQDAVQRAYDILAEKTSRAEYDGLWREFEKSMSFKGEDETITTAPETEASSVEIDGRDFWSEENTIEQAPHSPEASEEEATYSHRDFVAKEGYLESPGAVVDAVAYGSHGNYSYEVDGNEDDEQGSASTKETDNLSCDNSFESSYDPRGSRGTLQEVEDQSSKLVYSYDSEEEYDEEDEDDDEEEGEYNEKQYQHQYSPTDPLEFDQLIADSLPENEYFNQLSPEARREWYFHARTQEEEEAFDPFDLHGGHEISPDHSTSFPKADAALKQTASVESESISFVCKIPTYDEDDDEEGELTMGEWIEGRTRKEEEELDGLDRFDKAKNSVQESAEHEGPNISYEDEDHEDNDEIETFLSATSTDDHSKRRGILHQSSYEPSTPRNDEASVCSNRSETSILRNKLKQPKPEEDGDAIDCFPAEEEEGRKVRFNIQEEREYEYSTTASVVSGESVKKRGISGVSCVDELFEDIGSLGDDLIQSVERCGPLGDKLFEEIGSLSDDLLQCGTSG